MNHRLFVQSLAKHLRASIFLLLATLPLFTSCKKDEESEQNNTEQNTNRNDNRAQSELGRLEFPKVKGGNSVVLIHTTSDSYGVNYCVEWDKDKKSQRWSCYQLNSANSITNTSRYTSDDNQYPMDPMLSSADYLSQDCFWGSGFDHGHICPSADRLYSYNANLQTFYLTNMQPQYKAFNGSLSSKEQNNRSPWFRLEEQVRTWATAAATENLYVVKGGTIEDNQILTKDGSPWLLKGEMRIPKYFFVALLLKNVQGYKAIGFWMEHLDKYASAEPLGNYAVNIRKLEQLTGIDFFCNLPDETEEHVETLPIENVKRAWGL